MTSQVRLPDELPGKVTDKIDPERSLAMITQ
jgi:hypothetical protein